MSLPARGAGKGGAHHASAGEKLFWIAVFFGKDTVGMLK
jgi:hypothetical protein